MTATVSDPISTRYRKDKRYSMFALNGALLGCGDTEPPVEVVARALQVLQEVVVADWQDMVAKRIRLNPMNGNYEYREEKIVTIEKDELPEKSFLGPMRGSA